jgi:hypothetical protein
MIIRLKMGMDWRCIMIELVYLIGWFLFWKEGYKIYDFIGFDIFFIA